MCGRGDQSLTWEQINTLLRIDGSKPGKPAPSNYQPNYNVAPTHSVVICTERDGERQVQQMAWGLTPGWAKEPPKFATINAMCETIEEKATWKPSLNKLRCVVPFNGFYEWGGVKGKKQCYRITRRDGAPLLLAGLWAFNERIDPKGMRTFAIVTCPANNVMKLIHHRMPVVLSEKEVDDWLDGAPWGDQHRALLRPCPDDWLTAVPVSQDVGNVRNNRPDLLTPIGDPIF